MTDLSKSTANVPYSTFRVMAGYVTLYKQLHGKEATTVYFNDGKDFILRSVYDNMEKRVIAYYKETEELPNIVYINKPTSTVVKNTDSCGYSPRYLQDINMKQDTNYWCACNIAQQVLKELYNILVPEKELAKEMGTTQAGTGHDGIIKGIKKEVADHGHKVNVDFVNFSSLNWDKIKAYVVDPDKGLFFHDLYKDTWGHYEYVAGVCTKSQIVVIPNSLSGGYIERRPFATMERYIRGISLPSVGIVSKIS